MMHRQFTFTEFFFLAVFLLFLIFLFRIIKRQRHWSRENLIISAAGGLLLTVLSLLYSEAGSSGMYETVTYGFPRDFFEKMKSFAHTAPNGEISSHFNFKNFLQNFILYFLLILNITNLLQKKSDTQIP